MARFHLIAVLLLGLGFGVLATVPTNAAAPAPTEADKIAKLVEQLGSSKFEEREQASKDLAAIGVPALESLRKASKSEDAEISRRAGDLVKSIEKQAESQIALAPTKLTLVFKDTPLADAIAEIKKKTGYAIVLHDPENKLKDRKVTLNTGETTFWQAFDQFCDKAGIHEANQQELVTQPQIGPANLPGGARKFEPVTPPKLEQIEKPKPPEKPAVEKKGDPPSALLADEPPAKDKPPAPPAPPAIPGPPVLSPPPVPFPPGLGPNGRPMAGGGWGSSQLGQITLVDGKPAAQATDYAGAFRIRAVKASNLFQPAGDGEILFALEITPEPKIMWQNLIALRIDKALDDQDQKLGEAADAKAPGGVGGPFPGGAPGAVRNGRFGGPNVGAWNGGSSGLSQYVPIRLKKGEKPSKSLKELTGSISAQIVGAPKTLVSTDEITKSAGKTFKGDDGGAIKVISVDKDEKTGEVKAVFEFEPPAGGNAPIGFGGGVGPAPLLPGPPPPPPVAQPKPPAAPPAAFLAEQPPPAQPAQPVQPPGVQGIQIQIGNGGGVVQLRGGVGVHGGNGLKLVNDKGHAVESQSIGLDVRPPQNGARLVPQYVLTFTMTKDQTDGGKLTYSTSKSVTVDIPFNLKDVVLP